MKAYILDGSLKGVEFEISDETIKNLERINNIPKTIFVGQVYKIENSKYMIVCIGGGQKIGDNKGLTAVGGYDCGCWNSGILDGPVAQDLFRQKLIDLEAKYLGMFNEIFKEI